MRAMSLAADEAESEQNEMRTLQIQLEETQRLVATLSRQLADLRDQVGLFWGTGRGRGLGGVSKGRQEGVCVCRD